MTTPDTQARHEDGGPAEPARPSLVGSPIRPSPYRPSGPSPAAGPGPVRGEIRQRFVAGEGRLYLHVGLAGLFLLLTVLFAVAGAGPYLTIPAFVVAGFQALAAGVMPRFGVVLTSSGVTVRGWRTRHHPWSDVHVIEPVHFLWARSAGVRLTDGSTIHTWAPYDDFLLADLKFDRKVEAMQQWHAAHLEPPVGPNGDGGFGPPRS